MINNWDYEPEVHNIIKQCVFVHVAPKYVTMGAATSANSI